MDDVTRYSSLLDVPDVVLRSWAWGHRWDPGPVVERPGWGSTVWECRASCECGRVRVDVLDPATCAVISRRYAGGGGLYSREPASRTEARAEWARRQRARAAGVVTLHERRRASAGA